MIEKAHRFGDDNCLFGIVTTPTELRPGAPAVVLLNAGLVHRAGPFRMHVEMARRLAELGFLVLRMDQSALGDGAPRSGGLSYEERAVIDAQQAFDFLSERYGAARFLVTGLCAGAMNAHRVAAVDDRVVAAALLDGYAYRTTGFWGRRAVAAIGDPKLWRAGARKIERALGRNADAPISQRSADLLLAENPGADAAEIFAQDWPPQAEVRTELDRILSRGTRMLFIYTGGWSDYIHEGQFDEMFPGLAGRERVSLRFFPDADHTYLLLAHREAMLREVEAFARSLPAGA